MASTLNIDKPSEKQKEFLTAKEKYVAYGGARGGGKTWAVQAKTKVLASAYSGIRILIMRRTYSDLEQNHIRILKNELKGIGRYNDSKKNITLTNGSEIKFGYMDNDNDADQYQGQEYDVIFIDEATQFYEEWFNILKACLRGVNDFPKRMYLTCNPGGVGHAWVKRLFIDQDYNEEEKPEQYRFIQAKMHDNTALMQKQPDYADQFSGLDETTKRAWLEGDWDIYKGQYFTEFRREIHVCKPIALEKWWKIYRSIDYGLDMLAVLWYAVSDLGVTYVFKEVHISDTIISDAAKIIINASKTMNEFADVVDMDIVCTYAPPDLWSRSKESGVSIADRFRDGGVPLIKCNNNRKFGWQGVHEYLKPIKGLEGEQTARLQIFDCCRNLIRNLPLLQHDEKNEDDCDTEPHAVTHICDSLRYYCISRPVTPKAPDLRTDKQKLLDEYRRRVITGSKKRSARW